MLSLHLVEIDNPFLKYDNQNCPQVWSHHGFVQRHNDIGCSVFDPSPHDGFAFFIAATHWIDYFIVLSTMSPRSLSWPIAHIPSVNMRSWKLFGPICVLPYTYIDLYALCWMYAVYWRTFYFIACTCIWEPSFNPLFLTVLDKCCHQQTWAPYCFPLTPDNLWTSWKHQNQYIPLRDSSSYVPLWELPIYSCSDFCAATDCLLLMKTARFTQKPLSKAS